MRRPLRSLVLATCLVLSGGLALTAAADNRDDLVAQQEQNARTLEQLRASLEGTTAELQETYLALEQTRLQLPIAEQELRQAEETLAAAERVQQQTADRLAVAEAELADLEAQIAAARGEIERSQASLGELARTTYQNGTSISPLSWALGVESTDDFLANYSAMDSAVRSQTAVLVDMNELEATTRNAQARQEAVTERVTELKQLADEAVVEADAARDAAATKRARIAELKREQESLAADLEGRRGQIEATQAQVTRENEEIARTIAQIDEENRRKAEEERRRAEAARQAELQRQAELERQAAAAQRTGSSRSDASVPAPAPSRATFGYPIDPPLVITSPFGMRWHPIVGGNWMHYGLDLRSSCGNPQYAIASGTVADLRPEYNNGTHGNQVIINNGMIGGRSYVTIYNHLTSWAVREGQSVSKGQVIGYTGTTGGSTGCHVHFEVWRDGVAIDPMSVIGK